MFDLLASTAEGCGPMDDMPAEDALAQVEVNTSESLPHGIDDMF